MQVFIFSFNRGAYLLNAVRSAVRCLRESTVTVVDDGSTDQETLGVLQELEKSVTVVRSRREGVRRLGGLYTNMQTALDLASPDDVAFFMQDDMQVVRAFDEADKSSIAGYFSAKPRAAFLRPGFVRATSPVIPAMVPAKDFPVYLLPGVPGGVGDYYSDVCIAHVGRLREVKWQFLEGERANAQQARRHFSQMGHSRDPFVMDLPEVPIYRGRTRTLAVRWRERRLGGEVNPFVTMSADEVARLRRRDMSALPIAENFLRTERPTERMPFVPNLIEGSLVSRKAHYWEVRLRKTLGLWS